MLKLEVTQPSHGIDGVTVSHNYFFNITLEPISFLYLYHLIYVNKLRYQAFESKNGVGMEPPIQLLRYPFCVTIGKSSVRDEYYKSSTFRG